MGRDIVVHTEVKIRGQWRHWGTPTVGRIYALFEQMAGVRGRMDDAVSAPKGLPADVTVETAFEATYWGSDARTPSYLTAEEIGQLARWWEANCSSTQGPLEKQFGYVCGHRWQYSQDWPDGIEDIRWVFWFDN